MISVQRVLSFVMNYLHFVAVGRGEKQQEDCNIIKEVDQPLSNIQQNKNYFISFVKWISFLRKMEKSLSQEKKEGSSIESCLSSDFSIFLRIRSRVLTRIE